MLDCGMTASSDMPVESRLLALARSGFTLLSYVGDASA
jgi:hypothetical protein